MGTILVTGSMGQIGTELVPLLVKKFGPSRVIASDVKPPNPDIFHNIEYVPLDVTNREMVASTLKECSVTEVFHMAGILSALGERNPEMAFMVNSVGTFNILDSAMKAGVNRVMIPSTIGVFGKDTPRDNVPVVTVTRPTTMYGVTKVNAELLSAYFRNKFGLDVRGVRYPGIVSYKTPPSAGTTDYAVDMYYHAVAGKNYECYLKEDAALPMMYMPDALDSLMKLYSADESRLRYTIDYNISAFSFDPRTLAESIRKVIPDFNVAYRPDYRQAIAETWPRSLDSTDAKIDWGFSPEYDLDAMTEDMIRNLKGIHLKSQPSQ